MSCTHPHYVVHRSGREHKWSGKREQECTCEPALLCPVCQPEVLEGCVITARPSTVDLLRAHEKAAREQALN